MRFDLIQESEVINNDLINKYCLTNADLSLKKNINYSSFVGFVIKDGSILVSFPKHYKNNGNLPCFSNDLLNNELINSKLLMSVLIKYYINENHNPNEYYGNRPYFASSFPFQSFYEILKYYKKNGLYTVDTEVENKDGHGKINWKKTIGSKEYVISNDGIIYLKPYYKSISQDIDLVSYCMIDVINRCYDLLGWFEDDLKPIKTNYRLKESSEKIVNKLNDKLNHVFVDEKRHLIRSLIDFYENKNDGGDFYLKIYYFQDCWQKMVNHYLNDYFKYADIDNIMFENKITNLGFEFSKKRFVVDSAKDRFIEPDHYAEDEKKYYLFDSKYYNDLVELNYKQLSYQFLISNFFGLDDHNEKICVSALFLPGNFNKDVNFNIKDEYRGNIILKTMEYYLDVSRVMLSYVYKRQTY